MPYPSDFPILIYLLLALLAILLAMIVLNFICVIKGITETPFYQSFDKVTGVFVRAFGALLFVVVVWSMLAKTFGR